MNDDEMPGLTGRGIFWSTEEEPDDIDDWALSDKTKYFQSPSHYLKLWSFDPNTIPSFLIPPDSLKAGLYPIGDDGQKKARGMIMSIHNDCPQWLSLSIFPNTFCVSKADEKSLMKFYLDILKNQQNNKFKRQKKEVPPALTNLINQLEIKIKKLEENDDPDNFILNIPAGYKIEDVRVLDWLIDDFIEMFQAATSLVLMRQPFEKKPHADAGFGKITFGKKQDIMKHGKSICFYCKKCWERHEEAPVCFIQINTKDTGNSTHSVAPLVDKNNPEYMEQKIAPRQEEVDVQQRIGPFEHQQKVPSNTGNLSQLEGHHPAQVPLPNYHSGKIPNDLPRNNVGPLNSCRTNELMPRLSGYEHISMKVTHLFYHSCCCDDSSRDTAPLVQLKNNYIVDLPYNFEFVVGPTMDHVYNKINKVPFHSVTLLNNTPEEDKQNVMEIYNNVEKGPLIEEESLSNKSEEVQRHDDLHEDLFTKHGFITNGNTDPLTDSVCTLGPFHDSEAKIGRFHWFVSNARRHYITVCKYGAPKEMCPFVFNLDLYRMQCNHEDRTIVPFGGYWIKNDACHIYMNDVSIIFGGQELKANSSEVKHVIRHRENDNDEDDNENQQASRNQFPPSSCMAPFFSRSLMEHSKTKPPVPHDITRGHMVQFNNKLKHGDQTLRANERKWGLGWYYHLDSKHKTPEENNHTT